MTQSSRDRGAPTKPPPLPVAAEQSRQRRQAGYLARNPDKRGKRETQSAIFSRQSRLPSCRLPPSLFPRLGPSPQRGKLGAASRKLSAPREAPGFETKGGAVEQPRPP